MWRVIPGSFGSGASAARVKLGYTSTSFNTGNASEIISGSQSYTFSKAKDDFKGGYLFGAYSRIGLFGNVSLQPELYFAKKKGVTDFYLNDGVDDIKVSQSITTYTWDLPILLHLKLVDLKVANIYGVAGPVLSLKGGVINSAFPNWGMTSKQRILKMETGTSSWEAVLKFGNSTWMCAMNGD
jgi:hypothetical protein